MTPTELSVYVKERIGSDRLKQLTNYSATATTINDTVLDAASSDAIGYFQINSGYEPEASIRLHIAILVQGVQYFLEAYKGRDSSLISTQEKMFYMSCKGLRDRIYSPTSTTSNLTMTREKNGTRPDMDRGRRVLNLTRSIAVGQFEENIGSTE